MRFEPLTHDEVILVAPPEHPLAGRTVTTEQLRGEALIVMQEGAGVRQVVEEELRRAGMRLRDLDVRLELGLQESVRSAVLAGYGITFISRASVESELAAGRLVQVAVEGMDVRREISLARAAGRAPLARRRGVRRLRAREACRVTPVIRFGAGSLGELADVCAELGIARPLLVTTRRGAASASSLPVVGTFAGVLPHVPVETVVAAAALVRDVSADGLVGLGGGSAIDTCKAVVAELAQAGVEPLSG